MTKPETFQKELRAHKATKEQCRLDSDFAARLKNKGFAAEDAPFPPIQPEWERFPIIKAIRAVEKEIGITYERAWEHTKLPTDTDKSLPLMARREWMPVWAKYAGQSGFFEHAVVSVGGDARFVYDERMAGVPMHRIADTDEHGLPVIPRTADMPAWAKYIGQHVYCPAWHPLMATGGGWQRIEDYQGEQP